jgi:mannose-6-phosphate isomerase-like protein (cupin superfamily)
VRKLTTGVDEHGRSCLVEVVDVLPAEVTGHGVNVARAFATTQSPPPSRSPALGRFVDTELGPGMLRWLVVEHPPYDVSEGPTTSTTIHHANSLDLVFVHEGFGELLLQDGPHEVEAGDLIVMPGVDHAMRAGPGGCRLVVVSVGTPPPS